MEKTEAPKVSRIKAKKKIWCVLLAPKLFGQKEIGESYLSSPESAIGRTLQVNLRDITGNVKDQNAYLALHITDVKGSLLNTKMFGYQMTISSTKRMVRPNTDRIDAAYRFTTKTGEVVELRALLVTPKKTRHSLHTQLRKRLQSLLAEEISAVDFEGFILNLVSQKIQMRLRKELHKIHPLRDAVVRKVVLTKGAPENVPVAAEEAKAAPVEESPPPVAEENPITAAAE